MGDRRKNHSKKSELLTQLIRGIWLIFLLKKCQNYRKNSSSGKKKSVFQPEKRILGMNFGVFGLFFRIKMTEYLVFLA
jgi:hypothetical protein